MALLFISSSDQSGSKTKFELLRMAASNSLSSAHLLFPSQCRDGDARRKQYALARDSLPFVVCAARSSRAGESTFNSFRTWDQDF